MSVSFAIPDLQSLVRLVGAKYTKYTIQQVYGLVFEFFRFFRLIQMHPTDKHLVPSAELDKVWQLFVQSEPQYTQACGPTYIGRSHALPRQEDIVHTRKVYILEYKENPPAQYWPEEIILVPESPPREQKKSRERDGESLPEAPPGMTKRAATIRIINVLLYDRDQSHGTLWSGDYASNRTTRSIRQEFKTSFPGKHFTFAGEPFGRRPGEKLDDLVPFGSHINLYAHPVEDKVNVRVRNAQDKTNGWNTSFLKDERISVVYNVIAERYPGMKITYLHDNSIVDERPLEKGSSEQLGTLGKFVEIIVRQPSFINVRVLDVVDQDEELAVIEMVATRTLVEVKNILEKKFPDRTIQLPDRSETTLREWATAVAAGIDTVIVHTSLNPNSYIKVRLVDEIDNKELWSKTFVPRKQTCDVRKLLEQKFPWKRFTLGELTFGINPYEFVRDVANGGTIDVRAHELPMVITLVSDANPGFSMHFEFPRTMKLYDACKTMELSFPGRAVRFNQNGKPIGVLRLIGRTLENLATNGEKTIKLHVLLSKKVHINFVCSFVPKKYQIDARMDMKLSDLYRYITHRSVFKGRKLELIFNGVIIQDTAERTLEMFEKEIDATEKRSIDIHISDTYARSAIAILETSTKKTDTFGCVVRFTNSGRTVMFNEVPIEGNAVKFYHLVGDMLKINGFALTVDGVLLEAHRPLSEYRARIAAAPHILLTYADEKFTCRIRTPSGQRFTSANIPYSTPVSAFLQMVSRVTKMRGHNVEIMYYPDDGASEGEQIDAPDGTLMYKYADRFKDGVDLSLIDLGVKKSDEKRKKRERDEINNSFSCVVRDLTGKEFAFGECDMDAPINAFFQRVSSNTGMQPGTFFLVCKGVKLDDTENGSMRKYERLFTDSQVVFHLAKKRGL